MPFESTAQRGFMFANHPAIARRWAKETPKGSKLPERVSGDNNMGIVGSGGRGMSRGGRMRMFGGGIATGYAGKAEEAAMSGGMDYPEEEFFGGGVATGYAGDEGEASMRDGTGSSYENFAHGGECPNCGYAMGGEPMGDEGGPGPKVSVKGGVGGEEGPDRYATHGPADPRSPRESFGRALRKKMGHHGM